MGVIKQRVPILAMQKVLVKLLKAGQTYPVYDDVERHAKLPYITIGAINAKPNGAKHTAIYDVSVQLHFWSEYQGKCEINLMMNDVATVLTYVKLAMSGDGFLAIAQEIDFYEVFAEEEQGYHGVITLIIKIQDMECETI